MTAERREAIARELTAQGRRVFTSETYSREDVFAALREIRYSQDGDPHTQFLNDMARSFADEIAAVVDISPRDIATVLMAAGGSIGVLAEVNGIPGTALAGVLQFAADELDQRARAGEPS